MKVASSELTPAEIRQKSEEWFARQTETLALCHGKAWPKHQAWVEAYLKEELRQRLIAIGWRPKR